MEKCEAATEQTHDQQQCSRHLMPVRDALDVLSGKWKIPIIIALSYGNIRFKELHRQINISPKMLSKELKELEGHQLVQRTVYDTIPVSIEYSLTPYAKTLQNVIGALHDWGMIHRKKMMKK